MNKQANKNTKEWKSMQDTNQGTTGTMSLFTVIVL